MKYIFSKAKDKNFIDIYKDYLSELARTDSFYLNYRGYISHKQAKDVILLYEENTVVGFAALSCKGAVLLLNAIYVKPEFRRQGICTRLMKLIENYYYSDFRAISLIVRNTNDILVQLFESLGYIIKNHDYKVEKSSLFYQLEKRLKHKYSRILMSADSIVDFNNSYRYSIGKLLSYYKLKPTSYLIDSFIELENKIHKEYEDGKFGYNTYSKERFQRFFSKLDIIVDSKECEDIIAKNNKIQVRKKAKKYIKRLYKKYHISILTSNFESNELKSLLYRKGIRSFDKIYSLLELNYSPTEKAFINYIIKDMNILDKNEYVIISTVENPWLDLANNSNIDTIYLNYDRKPTKEGFFYSKNVHSYFGLKHSLK